MTRGTRLCALAAIFIAAFTLATPALANRSDDTIRYAFVSALPNIDPYFNGLLDGTILADQVWDTLIYRDPVSGEFRGNLATSWKWLGDRSLELDLRQDVKFHDGTAFDADDVVATLNFVSNPVNKALQLPLVRWIERAEKLGP